jgi:hypothetical protein
MKTVAAMTFQEGRGRHGSLVSLFFPLQKGKETDRGFTDENEQGT